MASRTHAGPHGPDSPRPTYSLRTTLAGTALVAAALAATLVAASYPVATAVALAGAATARIAVRALRRRQTPRHDQSRQVCVPATGVCVET
jgi:hypothetical protein